MSVRKPGTGLMLLLSLVAALGGCLEAREEPVACPSVSTSPSASTDPVDPFDPNAPGTRRISGGSRVLFEAHETLEEPVPSSPSGAVWVLGVFGPPVENYTSIQVVGTLQRSGLQASETVLRVVASDGFVEGEAVFRRPSPGGVSSNANATFFLDELGVPPWEVRYVSEGPDPGGAHDLAVTAAATLETPAPTDNPGTDAAHCS